MHTPVAQGSAELWYSDGSAGPLCEVDKADRDLEIYRPEVFQTIVEEIDRLDDELRALSLDIHEHPELKYEEHHAHDALTAFMEKYQWDIKKHHLLETAWIATFSHGTGGRTLAVNSEMDALPGIGHACGHNLIAIAGVAVALAVKAAMIKHDISGKIDLSRLSSAEEGSAGKVTLLKKGAYDGVDACIMCHPAPGPIHGASLSSTLAVKRIAVEYKGHGAHAALSPWEGTNALDASVAAYNNISLLRQQLKPTHRVHGIFEGKDMAPNIIPDHSNMFWYVRAPAWAEVEVAAPRVKACFEAAALATGCKVVITEPSEPVFDIRQNKALGTMFGDTFRSKFGPIDYVFGINGASSDFPLVCAMPGLHPGFSIPTVPNGGNHTPAFTAAAASPEAHQACLDVSKALALTGVRVLADDDFFSQVQLLPYPCLIVSSRLSGQQVKAAFEEDKERRAKILG
ncbi:hypothetical protein EVG20_g4273 [Dentipellis fragilis]|uniref:Peptidase M20 domain-containing protein 2 n=1 Tax=Dentipellis fragilis TaxID=205917 RepID=A0A4Y9YYI0_9AGAM|nr:hypothetical protein EVG20_g4273 [Dentipellis fragilis]